MFLFENRASAIIYNFLRSCNFSEDKKFLLPSNVCPIVPLTFLKAGVNYEFVDISFEDLCVDKNAVFDLVKGDTNYVGLVYVRTYGCLFNVNDFFEGLKEINNDFVIVDDRGLCVPSFEIDNKFEDLILFSTGYAKYTDIGYGGFGFLSDTNKYAKSDLEYSKNDYDALVESYKSALESGSRYIYSDSNWLDSKLPDVSESQYIRDVEIATLESSDHKRELNGIYSNSLPAQACCSEQFQNWRFNVFVQKKNDLFKKIFENELLASGHYEPLDGVFSNNLVGKNAKNLHGGIVNLFNDRYFTVDKASYISDLVKEYTVDSNNYL